jgi:methionine-rich copper-binding protein CopC
VTSGDRPTPRAPRRRPTTRRGAGIAGVALAAGALALVGLAQGSGPDGALPASAHDYLVSSSPAAGSTVDAPPSEVALTFSDVILDLGAAGGDAVAGGTSSATGGSSVVQVTGPDGQGTHFETGCAVNAGRVVSVPVALGASGAYTVTWRVVSADGHPVSDSIGFSYEAPEGAAASAGSATGPACAAADAEEGGAPAPSEASGSGSSAEPGTAAAQEAGVAPYLGLVVGAGIGIVVLAAAAVVLIVVTGRRKPGGAGSAGSRGGEDGTPPDGSRPHGPPTT